MPTVKRGFVCGGSVGSDVIRAHLISCSEYIRDYLSTTILRDAPIACVKYRGINE